MSRGAAGWVAAAAALALSAGAADDLDEARRLLREAKQYAATSAHDILVTIAGVQAAAGDLTGALATAAPLDETERRWWALDAIAVAQARAGDVAGAVHTATMRQRAGWRDATLEEVAIARAAAGDIAEALRVASSLPDPRQPEMGLLIPRWVGVLLVVVFEQARRGDVSAASATAAQLSAPWQSLLGTPMVAAGQARAGDVTGARTTARGITEAGPRELALQHVGVAEAAAGDVRAAEQTLQSLTGEHGREVVIAEIVVARAQAGDVAGARAQAKQMAFHRLRDAALGRIAALQARGELAGARATLAGIPDGIARGSAATEVVAIQAEAGDLDGALQAARAASGAEAERHAETWRAVAAVRARGGDAQACSALAQTAPSSYTRALALVGCAEGLVQRVRGAAPRSVRPWQSN